jgi:hypothetical protein
MVLPDVVCGIWGILPRTGGGGASVTGRLTVTYTDQPAAEITPAKMINPIQMKRRLLIAYPFIASTQFYSSHTASFIVRSMETAQFHTFVMMNHAAKAFKR